MFFLIDSVISLMSDLISRFELFRTLRSASMSFLDSLIFFSSSSILFLCPSSIDLILRLMSPLSLSMAFLVSSVFALFSFSIFSIFSFVLHSRIFIISLRFFIVFTLFSMLFTSLLFVPSIVHIFPSIFLCLFSVYVLSSRILSSMADKDLFRLSISPCTFMFPSSLFFLTISAMFPTVAVMSLLNFLMSLNSSSILPFLVSVTSLSRLISFCMPERIL